jgi:diguanylate cyclase (GGDEF)-like protein
MPEPKLRLLHVENDDMEAELFRQLLTKEFGEHSCDIVHVESMRDALKILKESPFNVIVLDLDLTNTQGIDNVRMIKEEDPDMPIVVLSGHDDSKIALSAIKSGAQDYVIKGHSNSRMLGLAVLSSIERKAYERRLFKQANHDELTGLPNRRMFLEHMQRWIIRANRWKHTEAIMFLDVNGFKKINDTLGHDVGDRLLEQIGSRLQAGVRASDMLARYGGDEFVIHLDLDAKVSREMCAECAEKIVSMFHEPIIIEDRHSIQTSISIGIAFYPEDGRDTAELIKNADDAMYQAKKAKKDYSFFTAGSA